MVVHSEKMYSKGLCFFVSLVVAVNGRKLPPGILPCSKTDPDINACALRNGRNAIQHIIDGVPEYNIPRLDPLHVTEIDIAAPGQPRQVSLALVMKDVDVHGLRDAKLEKISFDLQNNKVWWECSVPKVTLLGHYNVSGRVLVLPIRGHGPMNISLDNVTFRYSFDLNRFIKQKSGREYVTPANSKLVFDTTNAVLKLENLFNGDRTLSNQMNVFLNENWREMIEELGPPVAEALNVAVSQIMSGITRVVPFDEVFTSS